MALWSPRRPSRCCAEAIRPGRPGPATVRLAGFERGGAVEPVATRMGCPEQRALL